MEETNVLDEIFDGIGEDYQTDTDTEEAEVQEGGTDEQQEAAEATQTGENPEGENGNGGSDSGNQPEQEAKTYTLRVNHQDKQVTHEELMNFAQQGVDYARVKTQLEQAKNDNSGLQQKIDSMQGVYNTIEAMAKESNLEVSELLTQFEMTRYTAKGYTQQEARLAVERDHLKKDVDRFQQTTGNAAETAQQRADREIAEFKAKFPNVAVDEALVSKLMDDVQKGVSFSDAYTALMQREQEAKIAELEAALAAERQNKANRASATGSSADDGGKYRTDPMDELFDGFDY